MKQQDIFYTHLSKALVELKQRHTDKEFIHQVKKNMGNAYPSWLPDEPCLFFCRNIVTPNKETLYFLDLAKDAGLRVIFLEYYDKFVAINKAKYHLGYIHSGTAKKKIIDFKDEGKKIDTITTIHRKKLVDFHHELSQKFINDFDLYTTIDISKWFNDTRNMQAYYFNYFSLFIAHGILFENFLVGDKQEEQFLQEKFFPSIAKIKEVYGVGPLIYPLLPIEFERQESWLFYPKEVYNYINND
jgi:hypothetical protein